MSFTISEYRILGNIQLVAQINQNLNFPTSSNKTKEFDNFMYLTQVRSANLPGREIYLCFLSKYHFLFVKISRYFKSRF